MCGLHITHGIGKPFLVHIFKYSFCCRRDLQSFQLVYLDYAILYGHLGPDYDAQFTSISDPTGTSAPLPPGTMHKGVEDFEYYITYTYTLDLESSRTMVPNTLLPDSAFNESEKSIIRRFAGDQLGCLLVSH